MTSNVDFDVSHLFYSLAILALHLQNGGRVSSSINVTGNIYLFRCRVTLDFDVHLVGEWSP